VPLAKLSLSRSHRQTPTSPSISTSDPKPPSSWSEKLSTFSLKLPMNFAGAAFPDKVSNTHLESSDDFDFYQRVFGESGHLDG